MLSKIRSCLLSVLLVCGAVAATPARGEEDALSKAGTAVANVLFENDADEFASYGVRDNGFVDVVFARNTPDNLYNDILSKLQHHPDIKGVLAGKGGPTCSRF
jgi:hypothetical protein